MSAHSMYLLQDGFGNTALVAAVDKGHLHIVEILVNHGANVNLRNKVRPLIVELIAE